MVDFALSDEQQLLRDTARALFTKECPPSLVRDAFYDVTDAGPAAARAFHDTRLREWAALGDGPLVDLALFLEESGAVLAPGPLWVSAAWALPLLRAAGHTEADAVADGSLTATVAVADATGRWEPGDHDECWFVPHLGEVDRVVFLRSGPSVLVVDAAEVVGSPIEALDRTRPLARVAVPAGSTSPVDPAAVAYAAMCVDADDVDRASAVHVAKAAAGGSARHWARTGLQAHGGIGYTWEHDLHLRLRRAYGGDHLLGDADWHRDRLAALLLD